jgi:hypothetical protein
MHETAMVQTLIGVYDADGTIAGEVAYFLRARLGRAHCALCDVTHGRVRERADWQARRAELPVPFVTYHRDDQPDVVRTASGGVTPVVVAETDDGRLVELVGPEELDRCSGSPERLVESIEAAAASLGLGWPPVER